MFSRKTKAAVISIVVPLVLATLKAIIGVITGSISVLASALDSVMDVFSSTITMFAVRTAEKPADSSHPFGHGKAEAIAGLVQAVLIAVSASYLVLQATHRMIDGYILSAEMMGINVMIFAMIVSVFLSRLLKKVSRETQSVALGASALNFGADVWTNAGVLIALGVERWTAIKNADPVISVLISLYIILSAFRIGRDAITQLMDKTLPEDMIKMIDECVMAYRPKVRGYHKLRTRWVGMDKFIEFHLEIESDLSFRTAHDITEAIVADISRSIPNSKVTIHSDPI